VKYVRRIWPYFRPYIGLSVFAAIVVVLSAAVAVAMYWPVVVLIDNVLGDKPPPWFAAWAFDWTGGDKRRLVWLVVIAQLLLVLSEQSLHILHNYLTTKLEQYMTLDFRSDLMRHAQRLSIAYHDQKRSGMLIYAINFVASSAAGLVMAIVPLAQGALTLIGMLVVAVKLDLKLALLSMSVIPFLYMTVGYYARHIQPRLLKVQGLEGESLSIIHEAMSMIKVIVAFGREDYEYGRFRRQGEQAVRARVVLTVHQTAFTLVVTTITAIGTALVIGVGASHVIGGTLTVGLLFLFIQYLAQVYRPLEQISHTVGSLQDKLIALRMSFGVLDTKPDIEDAPGAVAIERCRGRVAFRDVGFHYTGRVETLKDISFTAEPGAVIAIVGPTGAGKSTLVSLIPRFYDAASGAVLLDGQDVKTLTLASLRAQVSIVLQDPLLFSGTIMENIRYGRLDATDDEVMRAAMSANAHDFITALPLQYNTELGERGTQISGGERQRISVARAFLKNAPILILDEPTSSIDSKTEAVILDALDRLMEGKTTFMIAHRLSTIRRADKILVLDHGRMVESGTHEELLARGGLYRQLHDMQTRQSRDADPGLDEAVAPFPGAV
jgi:ATP-binding cassette, subfamily B, bacterial